MAGASYTHPQKVTIRNSTASVSTWHCVPLCTRGGKCLVPSRNRDGGAGEAQPALAAWLSSQGLKNSKFWGP